MYVTFWPKVNGIQVGGTIHKSTWNGSSWSAPAPIKWTAGGAPPSGVWQPSVLFLPAQNLYLMFHILENNGTVSYSTSSDGANTWTYRGNFNLYGTGSAFLDQSGEVWLYLQSNTDDVRRVRFAINGSALQAIQVVQVKNQMGRVLIGGMPSAKFAYGKYWMTTYDLVPYYTTSYVHLWMSSDGLNFHPFDNGQGVLMVSLGGGNALEVLGTNLISVMNVNWGSPTTNIERWSFQLK